MRLLGNTRQHRFGRRQAARVPLRAGIRESGFTLIELMVTLVVAVVLVVVAVPSFRTIIASNKLTTAANDLVAAINLARIDAVRRNSPTQLCSNSTTANNNGGANGDNLANACTNAGNPAGAVYGFVDATNTDLIQSATPGLSTTVKLVGNMTAVRFGTDGIGHAVGGTTPLSANNLAVICTDEIDTDNRRIVSLTAGSIVSVSKATGACQ